VRTNDAKNQRPGLAVVLPEGVERLAEQGVGLSGTRARDDAELMQSQRRLGEGPRVPVSAGQADQTGVGTAGTTTITRPAQRVGQREQRTEQLTLRDGGGLQDLQGAPMQASRLGVSQRSRRLLRRGRRERGRLPRVHALGSDGLYQVVGHLGEMDGGATVQATSQGGRGPGVQFQPPERR
jgi:hypothetical protein